MDCKVVFLFTRLLFSPLVVPFTRNMNIGP